MYLDAQMEIYKKEAGEKEELHLLTKYNKTLLFGGGLVFSLLIIVLAMLAALFELQ